MQELHISVSVFSPNDRKVTCIKRSGTYVPTIQLLSHTLPNFTPQMRKQLRIRSTGMSEPKIHNPQIINFSTTEPFHIRAILQEKHATMKQVSIYLIFISQTCRQKNKRLLVWRNKGLDNRVFFFNFFFLLCVLYFTVVNACVCVLSS